MTIRAKMLFVLVTVMTLVAVQEWIDLRYASATGRDIYQLGKATAMASSGAHEMLDTMWRLEETMVMPEKDATPAAQRQTRKEGEALIGRFRSQLDSATASARQPVVQVRAGQTVDTNSLAQLHEIETVFNGVAAQWREFTNVLAIAPAQAEPLREKAVLPLLNDRLRPALIRYDESLNDRAALEIQQIFADAQRSQEMILVIVLLVALATLAAFLVLSRLISEPLAQFAAAAREVAEGNLQRRLHFRRADEFRVMGDMFNHMLDALQTTTVSRNELEATVRERTAELKNEIQLRRVVEAELRKSEQNLATTFNSIGDGVLVANAVGRVVRMNPVAETLTGWSLEVAFGRPLDEVFRIVDEDARRPIALPAVEALPRDQSINPPKHAILVPRTGGERSIVSSCATIDNPDGNVIGVVLVFRDITEERKAAAEVIKLNRELEQRVESRTAELRESERRHRTLLANLLGMAYRSRNDQPRSMEFMSEGCRELLGVEPEALTGGRVSYHDMVHPEDRERVWSEVQAAIQKRSAFTLEYRVKHANNGWRSVWEQGRAVFDEQGAVVALEGYITDITQRVEAEATRQLLENQLRQVQKLEAVGTLAGGIAHDFNNILAAILGSAELLKMDFEAGHPGRELLDQIFTAGNRARELVQQILMFSRRKDSERSVIHLQPVVKECLKLLRSTIPAMVNIKFYIDPECAPVLADPIQIHQVIMNLCTNSWHALPERGGRIEVRLEMCSLDHTVAAAHRELRNGSYVRLSIRDNGMGMDQATLERIFEPFFTTKPAGKGSGLGLSVVHGIVQAHEGAIIVESEPGRGAVFFIYFPAQASSKAQTPRETEALARGSGERILLVDDEEQTGRAMEKVLERLGYQISRFSDPEKALARFQSAPAQFDVVISDLAMPHMSGSDLAGALLKLRADVPIVLISGLIDQPAEELARRTGARKVLLKPVSVETFARELTDLLADQMASI